MCRCWQRCWEDFYWNCIEEKFCYDESIANYNPEEDEYYNQKSGNGFLAAVKNENNNSPVCIQPASARTHQRQPSNISTSKIHEDDCRQISTHAPILAPEIMSVFANSQIFHDHQPIIKKPMPSVHGKSNRDTDSEKLIFRLEGDVDPGSSTSQQKSNIQFPTDGGTSLDPVTSLAPSQFPSIQEEDDEQGEIVLRPHIEGSGRNLKYGSSINNIPLMHRQIRNVQSVPYFPFRPASENDIFSISGGSMGQISMTPEIPSISYSTLPKYYEETPSIEKYKETASLQSIQTANAHRTAEFDYRMPRYFGKADMIAHSAGNLVSSASLSSSKSSAVGSTRNVEKSKRLKLFRTTLPPLAIHLGSTRERPKDKGIE